MQKSSTQNISSGSGPRTRLLARMQEWEEYEYSHDGQKKRMILQCAFCHFVIHSVVEFPIAYSVDKSKESFIEPCSYLASQARALGLDTIPPLAAEKLCRDMVDAHVQATIKEKKAAKRRLGIRREVEQLGHERCDSHCPPRSADFDHHLNTTVNMFMEAVTELKGEEEYPKDWEPLDHDSDAPAHTEM
eukprot:gnl/TRDRNA2_/TRDRNA2_28631_c0_seq2.p2 gnl/TRDRNA2_/TRDRNA2_28631_c0~~gnl/TRDRNA2_/TRDRNA2_28631_c0_seq2.p2  ORF type:complete len:189 (-),score=31.32 gnl/TRDRNA2_/TRDRNA2_28631_c0_seq2:93-659(-)